MTDRRVIDVPLSQEEISKIANPSLATHLQKAGPEIRTNLRQPVTLLSFRHLWYADIVGISISHLEALVGAVEANDLLPRVESPKNRYKKFYYLDSEGVLGLSALGHTYKQSAATMPPESLTAFTLVQKQSQT